VALPAGIYHGPGDRPGRFFGLLLLTTTEGCDARTAGSVLNDLWLLYRGLQEGRVPDLAPTTVAHGHDNATFLLGIGPAAFALPGAAQMRPVGLHEDHQFAAPLAGGGGSVVRGSGLEYAPQVTTNPASAAFGVQVIADTKLAVDRAVVETWKHLTDVADPDTGQSALRLESFYLGFQRPDHRSWIDFHDGLSNMDSAEREAAITIDSALPADRWTVGGAYLTFLRLAVDLTAWRRLDRVAQELLVGRDKLSGCPLVGVDGDGRPVSDSGCPVAGTQIWETPNDPHFAEPPATDDPVIRASHVQRANHHQPAALPGSRRIFRQGYEFLEWQDQQPGFRAGLNFVSFQDTPERVVQLLTNEGWLGRVNFGGDAAAQPPGMASLLSVYAAGNFVVPPDDGEELPGASLFGLQPVAADRERVRMERS